MQADDGLEEVPVRDVPGLPAQHAGVAHLAEDGANLGLCPFGNVGQDELHVVGVERPSRSGDHGAVE